METIKDFKELQKVKNNYRARYTPKNLISDKTLDTYRKLRYGLRCYSESELALLTPKEKKAVIYRQERANIIINELAQDKLNSFVIQTMKKHFPDLNGNMKDFLMEPVFYGGFTVNNTITPLKLTQSEIITEFVKKGLLD